MSNFILNPVMVDWLKEAIMERTIYDADTFTKLQKEPIVKHFLSEHDNHSMEQEGAR